MKQSEIERELRQHCKLEVKPRGWKTAGGFVYWQIGPLFFTLIPLALAKDRSFTCSLRFKWLELDGELWRVLGLSSNADAPFSIHANGAFVLPGQEILSLCNNDLVWDAGALRDRIADAFRSAEARSREVAEEIDSLDSYVAFIQREHESHMRRSPKSLVNTHKEELLAALLGKQYSRARDIAIARIQVGDWGGFSSGGKTLYEHALQFCRADHP